MEWIFPMCFSYPCLSYHIISSGFLPWFFATIFGSPFVDHRLPEVASCKNHTEMFRVVDFLLKYDYEARRVKRPGNGSNFPGQFVQLHAIPPTHRTGVPLGSLTNNQGRCGFVGKITVFSNVSNVSKKGEENDGFIEKDLSSHRRHFAYSRGNRTRISDVDADCQFYHTHGDTLV